MDGVAAEQQLPLTTPERPEMGEEVRLDGGHCLCRPPDGLCQSALSSSASSVQRMKKTETHGTVMGLTPRVHAVEDRVLTLDDAVKGRVGHNLERAVRQHGRELDDAVVPHIQTGHLEVDPEPSDARQIRHCVRHSDCYDGVSRSDRCRAAQFCHGGGFECCNGK